MAPSDWNEIQEKFFDATAYSHGDNFQQANIYFDFVVEHFIRAVSPKEGERILELGASGGRFTAPLLDRGCGVTGVDLSQKTIDFQAQALAEHPQRANLRLIQDDAAVLGKVREKDFDAVVGAHILHHVEDVKKVFKTIFERLKPGGRIVFLEPNPWNPQWYVHIAVHPGKSWRVEKGILHVWPGSLRRQASASGFTDCRVVTFGCFPPFVINRFPAMRVVEGWMSRLGPLSRLLTLNIFTARKP